MECRQFFGQRQRMPHWQDQDSCAELNPFRHGGCPGEGQYRIEEQRGARELIARNNDVLADPNILNTKVLRPLSMTADQRRGRLLAGMRQMDAVSHRCVSSPSRLPSYFKPLQILS